MWRRSDVVLRLVLWVCVALTLTCRDAVDHDEPFVLVRLSPVAVSSEDGWRLFDRSIESAATPSGAIRIQLDREYPIVAIKAYGPAPYRLRLAGFGRIDLSTGDPGWRTFFATSPTPSSTVDLQFDASGDPGRLPERRRLPGTADRSERRSPR